MSCLEPECDRNENDGDIRLVGGKFEGSVEVCCHNGVEGWASVCADTFWDDRDAQVVCSHLGFLDTGNQIYATGP